MDLVFFPLHKSDRRDDVGINHHEGNSTIEFGDT
jgi:hypothetical protein